MQLTYKFTSKHTNASKLESIRELSKVYQKYYNTLFSEELIITGVILSLMLESNESMLAFACCSHVCLYRSEKFSLENFSIIGRYLGSDPFL